MDASRWNRTLVDPVSPERDHIRGPQRAPVVLVEYGDFECPYCAAAHPAVEAVRTAMGQSLSFVFRHFPLTTVHPHAWPAAESAESAGAQGDFWDMHDLLFEDQRHLETPDLIAKAKALHLNVEEFVAALVTDEFADHIQADVLGGVRSEVAGTPTFFVNGARYAGPPEYQSLLNTLEMVGGRLA